MEATYDDHGQQNEAGGGSFPSTTLGVNQKIDG